MAWAVHDSAAMPDIVRHFLGWDRPVLESTVAFLAQSWKGEGLLDLSDHLVVVPTRQAGRRLREGLARHAARQAAAVLPPRVVTPQQLVSPARLGESLTGQPVASEQIEQLIWTALLLRLSLDEYRQIFPIDPVERDLAWALAQARELLAVRELLLEAGLLFATAAPRFEEAGIETARWRELAKLEAAAERLRREFGFADPGEAALQVVAQGRLPEGVKRLVVATVPDLRPLAGRALAHYAESVPVDLLVPAPAEEASAFDVYGRPLPSSWLEREIAFVDAERRLHPCLNPSAQAERCLELLSPYEDPAACAAVGLPDTELAATLEQRLTLAGMSSYNPAGRSLAREGIVHLLQLLHDLVATERFASFCQLLRCPGVAESLLPARSEEPFRSSQLLQEADRFAMDHFPADLEQAAAVLRRHSQAFPLLAATLEGAQALLERLRQDGFAEPLRDFLSAVFGKRNYGSYDPTTAVLLETSEALSALESDLEAVGGAFPSQPSAEEGLRLLLAGLGERRLHSEREPLALDLQGWLELLWEDAPHLIIAGMNDAFVPESLVGHAFLPDAARTLLGLPDNAARFARDAFLLTLLVETRRRHGWLDLLFGRMDAAGSPLRPSRLLFQCRDSELAERTLRLFRGHDAEGATESAPARTVAWRLEPAPLPAEHRLFQRIGVTAFKSYLTCPFRFYLTHGLGMEKVEIGKTELSPMEFGQLIHAALESYAYDESMRGCTEADRIAAVFAQGVDDWLQQRFGARLNTPLLIQREAALRRLTHWARIEAEQREEGWEIFEVESELGGDNWPFEISGLTVKGRVDRIERHPEQGWRIVDFKTHSPMESGKIKTVDRYHLAGLGRSSGERSLKEWMIWQDAKGKSYRWIDLQVPLYALALRARFPGEPVTAGYVTLGRTVEEVRLDLWEDLDESLLESASCCARGVIESIRAGVFWPPSERMPEWDQFREMLLPTPDEAVQFEALLGQGRAI